MKECERAQAKQRENSNFFDTIQTRAISIYIEDSNIRDHLLGIICLLANQKFFGNEQSLSILTRSLILSRPAVSRIHIQIAFTIIRREREKKLFK